MDSIRDVRISNLDAVKSVMVSINDYDRESDLRIITNGYVQFSSSTNCIMIYQCQPANAEFPQDAKLVFGGLALQYISLFRVRQRYSLPLHLDVTNFLIPADNFLDIISGNSGVGSCRVSVSISISDVSGAKKNFDILILDAEGQRIDLRADAQPQETFYSVDRPPGSISEPTMHPVYRTLEADPSYRLCQRVRMVMPITKDQLSWRSQQAWVQWAQDRRRREDCEVRNGTESDCAQ